MFRSDQWLTQPLHQRWVDALDAVMNVGEPVGPRGKQTLERLDVKLDMIDATRPLLVVPERKLSYRFAVAEWLWIIFGYSDVATIERYNPRMREFSDDGIFLAGAYGPHVHGQWSRVLEKLRADPATRQAVIEIPRPRQQTKDEPCTLSLQFLLRNKRLSCIATMRSSDIWLGLPYDCFTFMQLQNVLAGQLGVWRGFFSIHLGSSHLYTTDIEKAQKVFTGDPLLRRNSSLAVPQLPGFPPDWLAAVMTAKSLEPVPSSMPRNDPWLPYAHALVAPSNLTALDELQRGFQDALGTATADVVTMPQPVAKAGA